MWEFHYAECGNFIMQNVGILLCRMWKFYYAECRDFIMQNVFFWHKASMYVIEKKAKAMIYNQAQNIILGISKNRFLV